MKRLIALLLLAAGLGPAVADPIAEDFGFGSSRLPATRPLLALLADYETMPPSNVTGTEAQWQQYLFRTGSAWSVNNYMIENSNGRFAYTPAAPQPLRVHMANSDTFASIKAANPNWSDNQVEAEWFGRIVKKAIDDGFPFTNFDTNGDHVITTPTELTILIVQPLSDGTNAGSNRPINDQSDTANTFKVRGGVPAISHSVTFATLAHELGHSLIGATYELYTQRNGFDVGAGMTIMAQTGYGTQGCSSVDDPVTFQPGTIHFDPWHKMRFGWSRPRLVNMRSGGYFTIPVATDGSPAAPLLLYDPLKGNNEFLLVEFRSRNRPGKNHDVSFAQQNVNNGGVGEGMVIWQIATQPNHSLLVTSLPGFMPGDPALLPPAGAAPYSSSILCRCPGDLNAVFNRPWLSGSTTPPLRWFDGTSTSTRIHVRPFGTGAFSIDVEILTDYETWVGFSYPGLPLLPEAGTFDFPYNTFLEGRTAVGYGGHLRIKSGQTAETVTNLDKPMTIHAEGGPVTIGRQP